MNKETEPTIESAEAPAQVLSPQEVAKMLHMLSLHFGCPVMPIAVFEHGRCPCASCYCKFDAADRTQGGQEV